MGLQGVTQRTVNTVRAQVKRRTHIGWLRYLAEDEEPGRRVVEALKTHLEE